ncbi:MAG: choice-of-anchor tandem repeat GloVer-containing protein [Candidatus Korobacteraceae bacterium]
MAPTPPELLIQAADGNFYGTTQMGGPPNQGTIFKMTPSGTVTTLYSFCHQIHCPDGANPYGGLILGSDGMFYGTTFNGGGSNDGTVFSLSVSGR